MTRFYQPITKEHIFYRGNPSIAVEFPALIIALAPLGVILLLRKIGVSLRKKVIEANSMQLVKASNKLKVVPSHYHPFQVSFSLQLIPPDTSHGGQDLLNQTLQGTGNSTSNDMHHVCDV